MRTSLLICATCLLVTGCSAQFRLPSLSSALSSLTGFGSGGGSSNSGSNGAQSSQATSPYSGLVRDYGRNLMMAMSSIYPTLFKPPQQQQQAQQQQREPSVQSPFEQFSASQSVPSQSLFSGPSGPSFSFGGSTFSISPSFPFGSLGGGSSQQQQGSASPNQGGPQPQGSHSPFSASFGSSINSPPSFGPLSSSPYLSQSMPSFAPASSYSAAFEAANGGVSGQNGLGGPVSATGASSMGSPLFAAMSQGQNSLSSGAGLNSAQSILSQSQQSNPINTYSPIQSYAGQHDSSAQLLSQPSHHQAQSVGPQHQSGPAFGSGLQQNQPSMGQQYQNSQQFRPDMMSIAASAPVPSSSSYSNYGSAQSQQGQAPASSSYQQPSYR